MVWNKARAQGRCCLVEEFGERETRVGGAGGRGGEKKGKRVSFFYNLRIQVGSIKGSSFRLIGQ